MAAPSCVFTIARVALMLGKDEDLLSDLAMQLKPEDGRLWIYDTDDRDTVPIRRGYTRVHRTRYREPQGAHPRSEAVSGASRPALTNRVPGRMDTEIHRSKAVTLVYGLLRGQP